MKRRRPMTWVVLAFNLLMLIAVVATIAADAPACQKLPFQDDIDACTAAAVSSGLSWVVPWAAGAVILGVIWLVTRPEGGT